MSSQMAIANQQERILIRGVVPNPYFPSSHLLTVDLDVTNEFTDTGTDYVKWKQGLEDALNELDRKHANEVGKLRGRKVDAKYRTVMEAVEHKGTKKKVRSRIISVVPYPSVYLSRLSDLRTEFYGGGGRKGILEKHRAIVLHREEHGKRRFVTWFLREEEAVAVRQDTEALNRKIEQLNASIAEFERTKDFRDLMEYMAQIPTDKWCRAPPLRSRLRPITLNFMPFPLSKDLVDTYMDVQIKAEVKESITKAVESIVKSFNQRLSEWLIHLTESLAANVQKQESELIQENLHRILEDADKYQVRSLMSTQVRLCEALVSAMQSDNVDNLRDVSQQVAAFAGVEAKGTIGSTLRNAALAMRNVDEETRAYLSTLF